MRSGLSVERMLALASLVAAIYSTTLLPIDQLQRTATAQDMELYTQPNYQQARQYSSNYIRQFLYSTSVQPNWIGKTDRFWYSYQDSKGTHYYLVDPKRGTKGLLFDRAKLAPQLSVLVKKPLDADRLSLSRVQVDENVEKLKFVSDGMEFEYDLNTEKLAKLGDAPTRPSGDEVPRSRFSSNEQYQRYLEFVRNRGGNQGAGRGGRRGGGTGNERDHRNWAPDRRSYVFAKGHDLYYVDVPEEMVKKAIEDAKKRKERAAERAKRREAESAKSDDSKKDDKTDADKKDEGTKDESTKDGDKKDEEKDVEKKDGEKKDDGNKDDEGDKDDSNEDGDLPQDEDNERNQQGSGDDDADASDENSDELPIPRATSKMDDEAIRLTKDGAEEYSFAGRAGGGRGGRRGGGRAVTSIDEIERPNIEEDQKTRPNVSWSEDSQSFYVTRRDGRDIKELWVINSLANPRPTLEAYKYPMPGEENIYKSELHTFSREAKKLTRVNPQWKDENYSNVHWTKDGKSLKFLRKDRLLRNVQLCLLNPTTGECKCLIEEGFENSHLDTPTVRYLTDTDEMIWWSERSGWGHFYLYDRNGEFKNAITSGQFRASTIVSIDEKNRLLYFRGNGQIPEENVYFEHLYSVRFDGSGLKMLDPGNANHSSTLSPSKSYVVDNFSAVDMAPQSVLRDSSGDLVLKLEEADLSRLYEVGWQMPSTFKVKAADGVTDLYGNMWKPFNFDPKKKYPIILHVYPGPQTEGTRHTFSATVGEQQLAQVGFLVIQVGHRGGAPTRSKAYGAYGYYNLRDYGLADKKAAVEQLAARFSYVDINRVGLYGHSGGGFMTAAALLKPPYNEFFKVGVSTAGNHDNNIYNNSWSERYHGLKLVEVTEEDSNSTESRRNRRSTARPEEDDNRLLDVEHGDYFYEYEYFNEDHEGFEAYSDTDFPLPLMDKDDKTKDAKDEESLKKAKESVGKKEVLNDDDDKKESSQKEKQESDKKESTEDKKSDEKKSDEKGSDEKKSDEKQDTDSGQSDSKKDDEQDGDKKDSDDDSDKDGEEAEKEKKFKFEIAVPTNAELAGNLKGHLFLIHGELDNNVHPANTLRLVDALIKANKRFDMLYLPEKRHGFGDYQPYVTQRMYEYFAEHLLNDYQNGADMARNE